MTKVLIASQAGGVIQDKHGDAQSKQATFRNLDGTGPDHFDGSLVTHYADSAGTDPLTTPITADGRGRLMRYIESGHYKQFVDGTTGSLDFHAVSGSVESDIPYTVVSTAAELTTAITALPSTGARLHIKAGQYSGAFNIASKSHLTISGEGPSTVIHNTTASDDALTITDCPGVTIRDLICQGTSGTRDGLHLERCNRARIERVWSPGTGRHGVYAEECIGIVVDQTGAGPDVVSPYPTGVIAQQSAIVLTWDGVNADSGCNQFEIRDAFAVVGKTQDWAIQVIRAEGGKFSGIPELSKGGVLLDTCQQIVGLGHYGEANPSDVEYTTGTASVTNGSATVTGSGTLWNTNDGEGNKNAMVGKYLVVGTSWARIQSIESDTSITLAETWPGTTQAGVAYRMTGVDLYLKSSKRCTIMGARGGGAILLKSAIRNTIYALCEQILIDSASKYNAGRVTTNRASTSATRYVDDGVRNEFDRVNYQTDVVVAHGTRWADRFLSGGDGYVTDAAVQVMGFSSGYAFQTGQTTSSSDHARLRITTAGEIEIGSGSGAAPDTVFKRSSLVGSQLALGEGDSLTLGQATDAGGNYLQFFEQTAQPAAAPANAVRLFAEDNGASKTRLVARFPTGAAVVIATEP